MVTQDAPMRVSNLIDTDKKDEILWGKYCNSYLFIAQYKQRQL